MNMRKITRVLSELFASFVGVYWGAAKWVPHSRLNPLSWERLPITTHAATRGHYLKSHCPLSTETVVQGVQALPWDIALTAIG